MLQLYIGNKNYSSWSMRPWVAMRQLGIAFDEVMVRFDSFAPGSQFRAVMDAVSPTGKVPLLRDGDLTVWDSLAIGEYLAERFPHAGVWPTDATLRAQARSVCAEMHSGFATLRSQCPMNIEAHLPEVGARLWTEHAALRKDVARIDAMWSALLAAHGGPCLFGAFSLADAFFAPVCMRLTTYALPMSAPVAAYVAHIRSLPAVEAWMEAARAEHDFRAYQEPYRSAPTA